MHKQAERKIEVITKPAVAVCVLCAHGLSCNAGAKIPLEDVPSVQEVLNVRCKLAVAACLSWKEGNGGKSCLASVQA